jgi:hypothetical protein
MDNAESGTRHTHFQLAGYTEYTDSTEINFSQMIRRTLIGNLDGCTVESTDSTLIFFSLTGDNMAATVNYFAPAYNNPRYGALLKCGDAVPAVYKN